MATLLGMLFLNSSAPIAGEIAALIDGTDYVLVREYRPPPPPAPPASPPAEGEAPPPIVPPVADRTMLWRVSEFISGQNGFLDEFWFYQSAERPLWLADCEAAFREEAPTARAARPKKRPKKRGRPKGT